MCVLFSISFYFVICCIVLSFTFSIFSLKQNLFASITVTVTSEGRFFSKNQCRPATLSGFSILAHCVFEVFLFSKKNVFKFLNSTPQQSRRTLWYDFSIIPNKLLWTKQQDLPGFVRVGHSDRVIGDVDHDRVFNFVDRVPANVGHLSLLGDQHNVVALQKTHKPCPKNVFFIYFFKQPWNLWQCNCKKQHFWIKQNKRISVFHFWQICRSTILLLTNPPKSMTMQAKWLNLFACRCIMRTCMYHSALYYYHRDPICLAYLYNYKSDPEKHDATLTFFSAVDEILTHIQCTIGCGAWFLSGCC